MRQPMTATAPSQQAGEASRPAYQRIVLKLSGESLQGRQGSGIDAETLIRIAGELKEVTELGVQMAIMVGGGNIFRGTRQKALSIDRATADHMGNRLGIPCWGADDRHPRYLLTARRKVS